MKSRLLSDLVTGLFTLILVLLLPTSIHAQQKPTIFKTFQALCGSTFSGEMTYPKTGNDDFRGKLLVAKIESCTEEKISIPFHVGDDKSRTWVLSHTERGLLFKHDHRHEDGSEDEISNYGGYAANKEKSSNDAFDTQLSINQDSLTKSFPADKFTQQLIPEAATNVWSFTFNEKLDQLTYHLERHNKPRFTAVLRKQ